MNSDLSEVFRHRRDLIGLKSLSVLTLIFCYSVLLGFLTFAKNMRQTLWNFEDTFETTVYLKNHPSEATVAAMTQQISALNAVSEVEYMSHTQALKEFTATLGGLVPNSVFTDQANPLPSSFILKLKRELTTPEAVASREGFFKQLRSLPFVQEVSYAGEFLNQYQSLLSLARTFGTLVSSILFFATLLILSGVVRSQVFSRRNELEVLELVGATRLQIYIPFLKQAVTLCVVSFCIALALSYVSLRGVQSILSDFIEFASVSRSLQFLSISQMLSSLLGVIIASFLVSWWTVRGVADGWAASKGD